MNESQKIQEKNIQKLQVNSSPVKETKIPYSSFFPAEQIDNKSGLSNSSCPSTDPNNKEREYDFVCKTLVWGNNRSGKSNLILRYIDDTYIDSATSTLELKSRLINIDNRTIKNQVLEIQSSRKKECRDSKYYQAHAVIMTVDMTDKSALRHLNQDIERYGFEDVVLVIAATKMDDRQNIKDNKSDLVDLCDKSNLKLSFVSAKENNGIKELFEWIIEKVLENNNELQPRF
jgi:GTPase SAR1 family protein